MTRRSRARLLALLVASAGCGGVAAPGTGPRPDEPTIAIVGVTVLPLDSAATLPDQTVIVRRDRIERVGPSASVAAPAGARIIDGHGRYLMPGLMDLHVHLGRAEDLELMLAFGITTVRNMWGAPIHVAWRDRIARGEMRGPTIITAGPILDGEPPAHPGSLIVRTEDDADRAIALHRRLGYDFVKIYSRLAPAVFDRLVADATREGLAVAGHVPWRVSLDHAASAGMRTVEHMTGIVAALQAADSPVAGHIDGASRGRQIDHVDETLLAPLARQLATHHTFMVPTLAVMDSGRSAADVRVLLAQPEMRYLPPWERALAEPGGDDPVDLDRSRRRFALFERVLRALDEAGAPIATGTDLENPLVIPGASLHHELELLVHAGLSPLAALQAATHRGADLLGRPELGGVAAGMRADLLLLDANPLEDIRHTRRIAGVLARGSYLDRRELDAILASIAARFSGPQNWFRDAPALAASGVLVFRGDYDIFWRGVPFGGERLAAAQQGSELTVSLASFDPHLGVITRARWHAGSAQNGEALTLEVDGATGRGQLEIRRDGDTLHARGTSLPGIEASLDHAIPPDALLAPEGVLSSVALLRPRLHGLAVGQSIDVPEQTIGLDSTIAWREATLRISRADDRPWDVAGTSTTARVYQLAPSHGPAAELLVDADGWPLELTSQEHGATLRLRRRPPAGH